MASVPHNLERKALKQVVITVTVKPKVIIPVKVGILMIRLGVWIAGLTYKANAGQP